MRRSALVCAWVVNQLPESSYGDGTVSTDGTNTAPSRRRAPRRTLRRLLAGLLVVTSLVAVASPAGAAGGFWGAGNYPYRGGLVCSTGTVTSPLTSWDVGASGPGFLVAPLTSDGQQDSAAPPLATAGAQQRLDVTPGTDGFTSAADIGAYAALLSGAGATGNDQQVAAVARLVMEHAGAAATPTCGTGGDTLLKQAAASAGPYQLTLSPPATPAVMGAPATVVATVLGGQGQPVSGMTVNFATVGGTLGTAAAITDANGHAGTTLTVPTGSGAATAGVTATIQATVGLQQITITATPSATNPSGTSVAAIVPAAPTQVTATAAVPIDQTARPVLTAGGTVAAVAIGGTLHPTASVSGMRGHSGTLAFTIYGPVAARSPGGCHGAGFSSSSPVAATTNSVPVVGDRTVTASTWAPSQAGCYAVQASLQTTDATPATQASSSLTAPAAVVTVLAATAQLTVPHALVGRGPQPATLTAAKTDGAAGTVQARLLGPLAAGVDGSCTGRDWSSAPTAATTTVTSHGDGAVALTSAAVDRPGCYAWSATLQLTIGDGQVPVPAAPAQLLLVTPSVSLTTDQLWSISPSPVGTHVTVTGAYGLPAHVAVRMSYAPSPLVGCRAADWTHAARLSSGPAVPVRGSAAVAVPSGAMPKLGCYQPVPYLTMDANPTVTASGAGDLTDNAIVAGVDINAVSMIGGKAGTSDAGIGLWVVAGILVGIELAAIVGTAVVARRDEPQETVLPLAGLG